MIHLDRQYVPHGGFVVKNRGLDAIKEPSIISSLIPKLYHVKWRYILLIFLVAQIGSWVIFGLQYWAFTLGDTTQFQCIVNVMNFSDAFLFSLESQTTIGFGYRYTNSKCWYGIITVVLQSLAGLLLQSCLLMIVVNKLSRPDVRQKAIQFSNKVVLYKESADTKNESENGIKKDENESNDSRSKSKYSKGSWHLKFRIGDIENSSYLMNTQINIQLIMPEINHGVQQNEVLVRTHCLDYKTYPETSDGTMIWPSDIICKIGQNHPLEMFTKHLDELSQFITDDEIKEEEEENGAQVYDENNHGQLQKNGVTKRSLDHIRMQHTRAAVSVNKVNGYDSNLAKKNVQMGRIVVLFNATSNENSQPVSSSKVYKLSSDLKVDYDFEQLLYQKVKINSSGEAIPMIEIHWDKFNVTFHSSLSTSDRLEKRNGKSPKKIAPLKLITIDTIT